ncbi:hypothetical protein [Streptococcus ovis]|uniref:hypothetical protein n=1 Tax=Streptococcus ovis TaxID=82806 RepID=UPI00037C7511|nr:hypothetical protein [Streptococcus ovis]
MFIVTNSNNQIQEFKNKDELLWHVENSSARVAANQQKDFFSIKHIAESGETLETIQIVLPLQSQVEVILENFGNARPVKTSPLIKLKSSKNEVKKGWRRDGINQKMTKKKDQSPRKSSSPSITKPSFVSIIATVLAIFGISLSGNLYVQQLSLVKELKQTQMNLKEIDLLQDKSHAADLFARYFLPNYYSGDKTKLTDYVMEDVLDQNDNLPDNQLQSVILETISNEADIFNLTYVVIVKKEETPKSYRLSFQVKEDKKSGYGFTVVKLPKISDYP